MEIDPDTKRDMLREIADAISLEPVNAHEFTVNDIYILLDRKRSKKNIRRKLDRMCDLGILHVRDGIRDGHISCNAYSVIDSCGDLENDLEKLRNLLSPK